jgi:hypothetical protein
LKTASTDLVFTWKARVDYNELREYIKHIFEQEYGEGIVTKVEVASYNPYSIDATVYVKEEESDMWDLCIDTAHFLRNQGIQIGIRTELAKEVLNEVQ